MTNKSYFINKPTFLILVEYFQTKNIIVKKSIVNFLEFYESIFTNSKLNSKSFAITSNYHKGIFSDYKTALDLLIAKKVLKVISKKGFNKAAQYTFSDEFKKSKLVDFPIDTLITYIKNKNRDQVIYLIAQQFDSLSNLDDKFLAEKMRPNLTFNLRKSTPLSVMSKFDRSKQTIYGQQLVEFDIRSSSFTLTTNRLMDQLPKEEQTKLTYWLQNDIYVAIADSTGIDSTRDSIKESFMQFLFSSNRGNNGNSKLEINVKNIEKFFKKEVPSYFKLILKERKKAKTKESLDVQYFRMETEFGEELSRRFYKAKILSISIYDAFLVPKKHVDKARTIINDIINKSGKTIQMQEEVIEEKIIEEVIVTKPIIVESVKHIAKSIIEEVIVTKTEKRQACKKIKTTTKKLTAFEKMMQELQN